MDCCEDGHLCVCEKPRKKDDRWDQQEEQIPLVTKFELDLFCLKDQVNFVRRRSLSRTRNASVTRNSQTNNSFNGDSFELISKENSHSMENCNRPNEDKSNKKSVLSEMDDCKKEKKRGRCRKGTKRDKNNKDKEYPHKQTASTYTFQDFKMNRACPNTSTCTSINSMGKPNHPEPLADSIPSTPKVTNHRKRRVQSERKQNVKKQRRCRKCPNDQSTPEDLLNMSLPTPKRISEDEKTSTDDDSDDDDLPVGLTPITYSKTLNVKDLVWVKWKNMPFLPAIIKHIYNKKRVTLVMFYPEDEPIKPFTLNIGRNIIPYFHPQRIDIMNSSHNLSKENLEYFNACVERVNYFHMKKALNELKDDWDFFKEEDLIEEEEKTDEKHEEPKSDQNTPKEPATQPSKKIKELSKKGQRRKEKLKDKSKDLTNFLLSDECKEYLFKIFRKEVESENNHIFMTGSLREKMRLKHRGFGPIDDEEQIEQIVMMFHSWLNEINRNDYLHTNNYVFDVWVPEAIVYGLKKLKRYSTKKAWEMFHKGVRSTKEELQLLHEELIRKSPVKDTENTEPVLKPVSLW